MCMYAYNYRHTHRHMYADSTLRKHRLTDKLLHEVDGSKCIALQVLGLIAA